MTSNYSLIFTPYINDNISFPRRLTKFNVPIIYESHSYPRSGVDKEL